MLHNCSLWRVAACFFREPTKQHYLLGISRRLALAHTSVKRHLVTLLKLGIIKKSVERRNTRTFPLYTANLDSKEYRHYKRLANLDSLKELIIFLADTLQPQAIVLFGSYERGEDIESSDIDLYLQCGERKLPDMTRFEKLLERTIQLHLKKDLGKYPQELQENIINGVTLFGFLEP